MQKHLNIDDFKELRLSKEHFYIDKTDFISEFAATGSKATLITRPHSFGKSLNLSTLKYFFDIENKEENLKLFSDLKISQNEYAMQKFATRPVIFLSFRNLRDCRTFEELKATTADIFCNLLNELMETSPLQISKYDKRHFDGIINKTLSFQEYYNVLGFLTKLMNNAYNKSVVVLLDDYEAPFQAAHEQDFYKEVKNMFLGMYTSAFKDNLYLYRAILTGLIRIPTADEFSGFNNLVAETITNFRFKENFGFTEPEVKNLLKEHNLEDKEAKVKLWYGGYNFSDSFLYCPRSIISFIQNKGDFKPYYSPILDNSLIKDIFANFDSSCKKNLTTFLKNEPTTIHLETFIDLKHLNSSITNFDNLLLSAGYLTIDPIENSNKEYRTVFKVKVPNLEIHTILSEIINN